MKARRIAALLTAALLSLTALTACSGGGKDQGGASGGLLAQIKERGEIIVAMEGTWSPWTYHNEADELVGYDVEVAQNIA